jgi:PAS domain S-box-containing protein
MINRSNSLSEKNNSIKHLERSDVNRPKIRKTLPELYRSVDLNGIIIDCNEAYANRLNYTVDEVIGMSLFEHSPPEDQEVMMTVFENWKKTGTIVKKKIRLFSKNQEIIDVILNANNRYSADRTLIASASILRDISEIKWLQNLVKLKKYESIYENSPDLYRTVNYSGIIIDCNKAYADKLGFTKEESIGANLLEHTSEKSQSIMRVNMASWRNTGKGNTTEVWMKRKDGSEFPALLTPTNLFDDDNFLIGRNVVIKDISELHDTKQNLSEREKIDQLKEEFLSVVTHELKSPLTPIIGFSQALSKPNLLGDLNDKQSEAVNIILTNATRLRKLIIDLLDAHKLELGKMRFDSNKFSVNNLLENVKKSFIFTAKEKNISIDFQIDESIEIVSDRDRIEQVLTNLIYNAIDFIPEGTGKVIVIAQKNGLDIKFSVKDNGIGIPKEKQKELFGKFYQADTSQTRKHGGTGLGLAICKGIVENLGGKIGLSSAENEGSNFYFVIPVQKKELA